MKTEKEMPNKSQYPIYSCYYPVFTFLLLCFAAILGTAVPFETNAASTPTPTNTNESPMITLEITGEGLSGSFEVGFRDESLVGLDIFDAFRPFSLSGTFAQISHLIGDQRLARSLLPTDLDEDTALPLEIRATTAGTYTITAALKNIPEGWAIEFEDSEASGAITLFDGTSFTIDLPQFMAKRAAVSTTQSTQFTLTIAPGVPPVSANTDLFGVQNQPLVLSFEQFPFTDTDAADSLAAIQIISLPEVGNLIRDTNDNDVLDAGEAVTAQDTISRTALNQGIVKWLPPDGQNGFRTDSVDFKVGDGVAFSGMNRAYVTLDANSLTLSSASASSGWRFITNPFDSKLSDFLEPVWTQGFAEGADINTGSPNVFIYQESSQSFSPFSGLDSNLSAASGLAIFLFTDDDAFTAGVQGGWPKTLSTAGAPQTGTTNVQLKSTDADLSGDLSNEEGWNLMGNPYGTTISVDSLLADIGTVFTGVSQGVYVWDQKANSGDGAYINLEAGNNERIAPFQAFFVRILDVGQQASAPLTNRIRTKESVAFRKQLTTSTTDAPVQLTLEQNGLKSVLELDFQQEATAGIDVFDGFHLPSLSVTDQILESYFYVDGQRLIRSVIPQKLDSSVVIPIQMQTNKSGDYTMNIQIAELPEGIHLELHNRTTGEIMPVYDGFELDGQLSTHAMEPNASAKIEPGSTMSLSPPTGRQTGDERYQNSFSHSNFSVVVRQEIATNTGSDALKNSLPRKVTLRQNYPNPFNPSTTITFALPKPSAVSLDVYTLSGRRVATLIEGQRGAGEHRVVFNAEHVSSGIYLYQLKTDKISITQKMVLIK